MQIKSLATSYRSLEFRESINDRGIAALYYTISL